jgi:hypothetical protein
MMNYSHLAAQLNDTFKSARVQVMVLHYHYPNKPKLVRHDVCEYDVGAVSIGSPFLEPILCDSAKFSDASLDGILLRNNQEGYGAYLLL